MSIQMACQILGMLQPHLPDTALVTCGGWWGLGLVWGKGWRGESWGARLGKGSGGAVIEEVLVEFEFGEGALEAWDGVGLRGMKSWNGEIWEQYTVR